MINQRIEQLETAYRSWVVLHDQAEWFSLFRPLVQEILPKISGNALKVYLYFAMNADAHTGEAQPSNVKAVAQFFLKSERAVQDWLRELQESGLIYRVQATPNGAARTYLLPPKSAVGAGQPGPDQPAQESEAPLMQSEPVSEGSARIPFDSSPESGASVGQRIRAERIKRGMSARQLSAHAGLTAAYLVELEQGRKTNPSLDTLRAVASVLGTGIGDLVDAKSPRFRFTPPFYGRPMAPTVLELCS